MAVRARRKVKLHELNSEHFIEFTIKKPKLSGLGFFLMVPHLAPFPKEG
jgi:hypothetical protein